MKICGHGTILALINNRKSRTTQLIQLTVLGFLVSGLKYCFMKPLHSAGAVFVLRCRERGAWHGIKLLLRHRPAYGTMRASSPTNPLQRLWYLSKFYPLKANQPLPSLKVYLKTKKMTDISQTQQDLRQRAAGILCGFQGFLTQNPAMFVEIDYIFDFSDTP